MKDMEIEKSFTKEDYRSWSTKTLKIIMAIKKKLLASLFNTLTVPSVV